MEGTKYTDPIGWLHQCVAYLEHAVAGVDKRFVDAEFSISHQLLSVEAVAADQSATDAVQNSSHPPQSLVDIGAVGKKIAVTRL